MPPTDKTEQKLKNLERKLVYLEDDVKTLKSGIERALKDEKAYIDGHNKKQADRLKTLESWRNTHEKSLKDYRAKLIKEIEKVHDNMAVHVKKRDKGLDERIKKLEKKK